MREKERREDQILLVSLIQQVDNTFRIRAVEDEIMATGDSMDQALLEAMEGVE